MGKLLQQANVAATEIGGLVEGAELIASRADGLTADPGYSRCRRIEECSPADEARSRGLLAQKIRIPDVAIFLIVGIAIGPHALGLVDIKADFGAQPGDLLFGASYILFDGGASLRFNVLKQVWITIVFIATVGVIITAAVTGLAAHFILGRMAGAQARTYAGELIATPPCAARRSDCGGWPKARMKARRIRSGSRKPVASRDALDRLAGGLHALPRHLDAQPLHRLRRRGAGLGDEGAGKMPRTHAGLLGEILHRQRRVEMFARPGQQRPEAARSAPSIPAARRIATGRRCGGDRARAARAVFCAISSPKSSATIASARSMPAVIPAELQMLPSRTKIRSGSSFTLG